MDITGIFSEAFWYVAPILVTLTTTFAGLFNQGVIEKFVPEQHRAWLKQLVAWVFGAALSVGAWGVGVIAFGNPVWLGIVALCVVVGLSSNGVYDIPFIKNWVDTWFKVKSTLVNDNVAKYLNGPTQEVAEQMLQEHVEAPVQAEEKPLKVKVKKTKKPEQEEA